MEKIDFDKNLMDKIASLLYRRQTVIFIKVRIRRIALFQPTTTMMVKVSVTYWMVLHLAICLSCFSLRKRKNRPCRFKVTSYFIWVTPNYSYIVD